MSEKRRALGRGLGALIPTSPGTARPVDVFFKEHPGPVPGRGHSDPDDDVFAGQGGDTGTPATDGRGSEEAGGNNHDRADEQGVPPVEHHRHPENDTRNDTHDDTSNGAPGAAPTGLDNAQVQATDVLMDDANRLKPVPGAVYAELPIGQIRPNPKQPRTVFDEDELAELSSSIKEIGVLQPVVVRRVPGSDGYELIMGERRLRASLQAGAATIPAIIKDTGDDALLRDALLENLHRSQLNPLEEAAAYQQLLDDFGCSHEELATRIGRSRPQISNTLRLLRLPPLVARRLAAGVLSAGHARALLGLEDGAAMERVAQRIVAEGLSVRSVEEIVALGGDHGVPQERARRPRAGGRHPQLDDLAAHLSDRFDTRVSIALGQRKGRLTVEFASVDDLNRIVALMDNASSV